MQSSTFHFAEPFWLWGLAAIPVMILLYVVFYRSAAKRTKLDQFADVHLLPHILVNDNALANRPWKFLLLWSLLWSLGMLAVAGPRWDYTKIAAFKPSSSLVILLDLSHSMEASDMRPSRMTVAREKIEEVIKTAKGVHIGLVGYAADAHMISPITDDKRPILDLLPYLDTSLPHVQGNNLIPALAMASSMLGAEKGGNKSVLIISDGGFRDDAAASVRDLLGKNVSVYAFGIGTSKGAPMPAPGGGWIKDADDRMVMSKLNDQSLQQVVNTVGRGFYKRAEYTDGDVRSVLEQINAKELSDQVSDKTTRIWQEHYYVLVLAMALLCLLWYLRGYTLPLLALLLINTSIPQSASAATPQDVFLNRDQQGRASLDRGEYAQAEKAFTTPYRRGIAEYRAGHYGAAEKSFADATSTVPHSQYNMANAQMMEGKYEDAIGAYEVVLKRNPKDAEARHNLDIARRLLEQKKNQQQQQKGQNASQKDSKQGNQQSSSAQKSKEDKGKNSSQSNSNGKGKAADTQKAQQNQNGSDGGKQKTQQNQNGSDGGKQKTQQNQNGSDAGKQKTQQNQNGSDAGKQKAQQNQNGSDAEKQKTQQNQNGSDRGKQKTQQNQNGSDGGKQKTQQNQNGSDGGKQETQQNQNGSDGGKQKAQKKQNGHDAQENRQNRERSANPGQQSTTGQAGPRSEAKPGTQSTVQGSSPGSVTPKPQSLPAARKDKALESSASKENNPAGPSAQDTGTIAADQPHLEKQTDINADRWLNRIENDPQTFLKNQFMVESERNGTKQGDESW